MRSLFKSSLFALALSTGATSLASAETLRWGDHLPECCSIYAEATKWMIDEVEERSNGDLTIDISWGGTLATVGEVPAAVENNIIDIGNLVTPYFPDQFIINNAIPFFWPQPKSHREIGELMLKWHEEIPAFAEELARYNLKLIGVRPLPPYGMICTQPIRTLEDFKGKRIRSYGVALPAMLEAVGAVPVSLADVEGYEALSNNILDCSVADVALVEGFKWDEVAKYFIDVPMGASWGHIIVMNTDKYEALSDEHKQLLKEMEQDHLDKLVEVAEKVENDVREKWGADGTVEVIDFPDDVFLDTTLGNSQVQTVRDSWKERAIAAGMPEEDAEQVVEDIRN